MSGTKTIDKTFLILKHLLTEGRDANMEALCKQFEMPQATLYRHIAALEKHGLISRATRSGFKPGPFLLRRFDWTDFCQRLKTVAQPIVEALSEQLSATAHLGVLEEDMVTYLIKSGTSDSDFFTRESTQLDAYCSGLGKVLLGSLPPKDLDSYFTGEPLPALTENTIIEERQLRKEIRRTSQRGYAVDNEEFEENLFCIAAPIVDRDKTVIAALSISSHSPEHLGRLRRQRVTQLRRACSDICDALYH